MRSVVVLLSAVIGCGDPPAATVDAGPDAEILAASCSDGMKNGSETDLDCGGTCGACAVGKVCTEGHDCANGTCFGGTCADRMWFAESTGTNVAVPAGAWGAAPGASISADLKAASLVVIQWMGTSRYAAAGGNTVCHLGQRFKIDGVATGDATWGDAIMVQRGDTRWHEPFDLELAVPLAAGTHTISAEMTNAGAPYASCNLDGDSGQEYDRSYLAVAAYDPSTAWYAESTGSSGALPGGSAWTDIPGVSVSVPLTDVHLVQVSVNGSQLAGQPAAGGGTVAHCAYRLVVDGTPLGDASHGQAISVGDVNGGWWAPVTLKWAVAMPAGTHTIKAQVRNSGGATGTCDAGAGNQKYSKFRVLATIGPIGGGNIAVESTGASQYLGSTSAWTTVSGLQTTFSLGSRGGNVQIELAGTQRTTTGSGHCAYRLTVDSTVLGNTTHGQAIDVGDGANAWWSYVGLVYGAKLDGGPHDVKLEVRNSGTTGDCGVNGDNLPYGRVRLLVRNL